MQIVPFQQCLIKSMKKLSGRKYKESKSPRYVTLFSITGLTTENQKNI